MSVGIEAAVPVFLAADAGVQALAGSPARVWPRVAPQDRIAQGPFVVTLVVSSEDTLTLDGVDGLTKTRVQIDCWSPNTYAEAMALGKAVRKALNAFSGSMDGITVQGCFRDAWSDDHQKPVPGNRVGYYLSRQDFLIWWVEVFP